MDPRTLVVLLTITGIECSVLFFAAGFQHRNTPVWSYPPSLFWGIGEFLNALGIGLLLNQGRGSPWIHVILSNATILLGMILILIGIRRLANRKLALPYYVFFWTLFMLLAPVFTFLLPSTPLRIVLFSCIVGCLYLDGGIILLDRTLRSTGPFSPLIAVLFFLFAFFFGVRAVVSFFSPLTSVLSPGTLNSITFLVSHIVLIAWSLGLILLQNRKNEQALERAYTEKEILFRELQHRVKNSLAVISGLVGLESSRIDDDRMRSVLENLRGRVDAVAVLYDRLFRSGKTEDVELDLYLRTVAESLFSSLASVERGISLDLNLSSERIDTKRAVPLGIIANELLMDSFKYAFPDGRGGRVRVSLVRDGTERICF